MRQFTISAAAMTVFAALLASAPAGAVENLGPNKIGNQCFKASAGHTRDLGFGTWTACPQTASTTAAPRSQIRRASR
jgi:hypothetical protein